MQLPFENAPEGRNQTEAVSCRQNRFFLQHSKYFTMSYLIKGLEDVEVDNVNSTPPPVPLGTNKVKHLNQLRNARTPYHEATSTAPDHIV